MEKNIWVIAVFEMWSAGPITPRMLSQYFLNDNVDDIFDLLPDGEPTNTLLRGKSNENKSVVALISYSHFNAHVVGLIGMGLQKFFQWACNYVLELASRHCWL